MEKYFVIFSLYPHIDPNLLCFNELDEKKRRMMKEKRGKEKLKKMRLMQKEHSNEKRNNE